MANKERRLFVRVTDEEHARSAALAEGLGLTVSDLIRVLLQLPAERIGKYRPHAVLVIDATSAAQLARQTRLWGYQHSQIAHYMGRGMADADDVMEQLQIVEEKVDKANADIAVLRVEAQRMAAMFNVKK